MCKTSECVDNVCLCVKSMYEFKYINLYVSGKQSCQTLKKTSWDLKVVVYIRESI